MNIALIMDMSMHGCFFPIFMYKFYQRRFICICRYLEGRVLNFRWISKFYSFEAKRRVIFRNFLRSKDFLIYRLEQGDG